VPWESVTLNLTRPTPPRYDATVTGAGGFLATVRGFDCTVSFQSDAESTDALKRLLGCLAIVYMPSEALDETLSELKESWDFYWSRRELPSSAPTRVVTGRGTVTAQTTRPPLSLSE